MTTEEKLAIAIQTLETLSSWSKEDPQEPDPDSDYWSRSGGNADDAAEIGRFEAYAEAAFEARECLKKIKE